MDARRLSIGPRYREWLLGQVVCGSRFTREDDTHLRISTERLLGEVNFYDLGDGQEVVEMRISRANDDEQVFFLHFMLDDELRARTLFVEMAQGMEELESEQVSHVLLCCTCGITTSLFALKMNEVAQMLGLSYDFEAKPLDRAQADGGTYDAVMLAPQVAHLRGKIAKSFPDAVVFEIPARVFGSYDAPGAVRLAMRVLEHERVARPDDESTALKRLPEGDALNWDGRIMVVSADFGARQSTYEYRVYEKGNELLRGRATKTTFDFRDIEDLLAGVRLQGIDVGQLDAIGIAVPGVVDQDMVTLFDIDVTGYKLGRHIQETYGVPVFLDNDANAAAAGCNAVQASYHSIMYHRESFGHGGCGQGSIVGGVLLTGRKNFAGELNHLVPALRLSGDADDLAWTEDGMYELVSRFVLANACTVAPDAVYVDAWPVTDMERLRAMLVPFLTKDYVPDLIVAPDFTESMLLGELALCVQRLR